MRTPKSLPIIPPDARVLYTSYEGPSMAQVLAKIDEHFGKKASPSKAGEKK